MAGGLLLSSGFHAIGQQTVDLADRSVTSGEINGAIYSIDTSQPAGTGIFGRSSGGVFLTIQNNGVEEGYNTSGGTVMDTKRVSQWNHDLQLSALGVVTIGAQEYIPFLLDINESATNKNKLLSMDDVKIFTSSTPSITNPTLGSLLADPRLTLRYDMDAGATRPDRNWVLLDYTRSGSGSGQADLALFLPVNLFTGLPLTEYLYLYTKFGGDVSAGDADAGFEEWTPGKGTAPIPEPGSLVLAGLGMAGLLGFRRPHPRN